MLIKLIRLGRDSELRTTQGGKQLLSFAGAYDIGFGDKKRTQWLDCTLWGDRGVNLQQYLVKGAQVVVYGDDVELEQFTKGDGSMGAKLKCRIVEISLAGGQQQSAPQAPRQQPASHSPAGRMTYQQPAPQPSPNASAPNSQSYGQPPQPAPGSFDDLDDGIPFN